MNSVRGQKYSNETICHKLRELENKTKLRLKNAARHEEQYEIKKQHIVAKIILLRESGIIRNDIRREMHLL